MPSREKPALDKIRALLEGDAKRAELQFKLLSILLIYHELLCSTIIEKTKGFFSNYFSIENGKIIAELDQKYFDLVKDKKPFRACRDFHLRVGAISRDDDALLDRIVTERNRAAHEIREVLLDGAAKEIEYELIFDAVRLFKKIDNWWIVNFEAAIDPDFEEVDSDLSSAASLQSIILDRLILSVFSIGPTEEMSSLDD